VTFRQLLRSTVLLSFGSASVLALLVVLRGYANDDTGPVAVSAIWWVVASAIGIVVGRHDAANPQIASVLADARAAEQLPEHRPVRTLLNRLWPLFVASLASGAATFVLPQVTGVAAGFLLIWGLAWRRQEHAVQAIEERDGVEFHVERTGLIEPLKLVRLPGLRRNRPEHKRQASSA
jgi:hypothetical protein